jgi:hypothetical protein
MKVFENFGAEFVSSTMGVNGGNVMSYIIEFADIKIISNSQFDEDILVLVHLLPCIFYHF